MDDVTRRLDKDARDVTLAQLVDDLKRFGEGYWEEGTKGYDFLVRGYRTPMIQYDPEARYLDVDERMKSEVESEFRR